MGDQSWLNHWPNHSIDERFLFDHPNTQFDTIRKWLDISKCFLEKQSIIAENFCLKHRPHNNVNFVNKFAIVNFDSLISAFAIKPKIDANKQSSE